MYDACRDGHLQWLSESQWRQCQYVGSELEPFALLCKSLLSNVPQWDAFRASKAVYSLMTIPFSPENASVEESEKSPKESKRAFVSSSAYPSPAHVHTDGWLAHGAQYVSSAAVL